MTAAPIRIASPAADPHASFWVKASAGTGKTTVLIDRLLRLLLDGTDPTRILCLTFTRAAAAEMATRLDIELAKWATPRDDELARALTYFTAQFADEALIARARQLFALVLDTPGGIKISTIHAFCQSLLRRFPLEAGVSPEFAVVEDRDADELLAEAAQSVIIAARDGGDTELAEALAIVAGHTAEERFGELMKALVRDRGKLEGAWRNGPAALKRRLSAALLLAEGTTIDSLIEEFCAAGAGDAEALCAAVAALAGGSEADRCRAAEIDAWWRAEPRYRRDVLAAYESTFLTEKGEIRKSLISRKAASRAGCAVVDILGAEARRVLRLCQERAASVLRDATCALVRLGDALVREYDAAKRLKGVLDFDDLVSRALDLLQRPGVAPWVLFKLDGGIDHILIDEAQDTNPQQWQIVQALAEEFFAGEGARGALRTVFAVGDPKQSIFSFQGVDPASYERMRRHFADRVNAAHQDWLEQPLTVSYRSTKPILQAVDAVFRQLPARDGVAVERSEITLDPDEPRASRAGLVELWPPVMPEPEDAPDPLALPVVSQRGAEPYARLARAIAEKIRQWLDTGERLQEWLDTEQVEPRDRPLRPGDIMVLVRRRNDFVGELLNELKKRHVPVAGADRLILTEQLAVQDLMAIGRFLLLPEDDLTLAAVLKSPLFDIAEDALFDLCHERGDDTLWDRLRACAETDPKLRRAADRLSTWLGRADYVPPHELYAEILGAEGARRAFRQSLGPEAEDPIEEFLGLALAYERDHVPSLQGFLRWLTAGETEVKRDSAARLRDEVRVLTVHGAKGLEAPVVFLTDTMALPKPPETFLWTRSEQLPLWCPRADFAAPFYAAEREAVRRRQLEEYRRLLYVGLTRAQDRLYICGWETRRPAGAGSWHALCRAGLAETAQKFDFDTRPLIGEAEGWSGEGLRIANPQTRLPKRALLVRAASDTGPLSEWVSRPPPDEPDPPRPLVPSRPEGDEPAALSPVAPTGAKRFKRGLLVHALLQTLPGLPESERKAAARRFLARPVHALAAEIQKDILRETLAVLAHPDFAPLFGPGSLAEVPLVGLIGGRALAGQIDRLVVTADRVLIVDYKTSRSPPVSAHEVAPIYLRQLASYRAALAGIYPDREIQCALLWTEGPRLMPIDAARLAGW
jgi:ATP-dependent helicase/nuclease subunit A